MVGFDSLRILTLGGGQDVGRSCVVVALGGRQIMLDCGMHMGYEDARKFPELSVLGSGASSPPTRGHCFPSRPDPHVTRCAPTLHTSP